MGRLLPLEMLPNSDANYIHASPACGGGSVYIKLLFNKPRDFSENRFILIDILAQTLYNYNRI